MFHKLDEVEGRFEMLTAMMGDPTVAADNKKFAEIAKERARLEATVTVYRRYKEVQAEIEENRSLIAEESDDELKELAREEIAELEPELEALDKKLMVLLVPADPNDDKNVLIEVRAGTGGEEAALFAGDLQRMYSRFAEAERWKVEIMSSSTGAVGGFKEVVMLVSGERVYSRLKFEAGTHRVQRVPATESQGRIHTSACTVAILPEADDVEVKIDETELRIDTYRSSGAGGQHVNTTDSAIRITHLPSGLVVTCQDERSQHKNKAKAMKILKARLFEQEQARQHSERASERKGMVGSGDRSERIRTYNYPQNRVTDHRIDLTLHKLDQIMEGEALTEVIESLIAHATAESLKENQTN